MLLAKSVKLTVPNQLLTWKLRRKIKHLSLKCLFSFSLEKQTRKPINSAATLERLFFLTATCKYA